MRYVGPVLLALLAIVFGAGTWVAGVKSDVAMSNLQLADDASTPEQKAKFLRDFLHDMDGADLPAHAAWIWKSERNKIANQRIVIESLIKRCDDLSGLDKESMGFSQGMTQITGQEFDHTMYEVGGIYQKAFLMSYGWLALNMFWIIGSLAFLWACGALVTDPRL